MLFQGLSICQFFKRGIYFGIFIKMKSLQSCVCHVGNYQTEEVKGSPSWGGHVCGNHFLNVEIHRKVDILLKTTTENSWWRYRTSHWITEVIWSHWTMNVCSNFHNNRSKSCWAISVLKVPSWNFSSKFLTCENQQLIYHFYISGETI